jgi:hypothetical protein
MNSRITIQEELEKLNSTLPLVKMPVFSVPDNYFENFALSVLLKIKEDKVVSAAEELDSLSPVLAGISKQMPFSVPENYFASLANELPVLTGSEDLPFILQKANQQNPYSIPAGYFENLSAEVLSQATSKEGAKVVSMGRQKWMRMAVAATIIGFIAFGSMFYFNDRGPLGPNKESGSWIAKKLQGVSDKELEDFVITTGVATNNAMAQTSVKKAEIRSMLKDVSDDELDDFLAEVPADDEEPLLIN